MAYNGDTLRLQSFERRCGGLSGLERRSYNPWSSSPGKFHPAPHSSTTNHCSSDLHPVDQGGEAWIGIQFTEQGVGPNLNQADVVALERAV
jgi:hypothetical protein